MKINILLINNIKFILLILFSSIVQINLIAQSSIKIIELGDIDFIQHSIVETRTGEFIVAGTVTPGHLSGSSDIVIMKLDSSGSVQWSNYVDYGEDEFVGSIMVDAENNILITGYKGQNGGASPNKQLIIVKISMDGKMMADAVIEDIQPNYRYSLYGTDIEFTTNYCEENGMDYIVVGIGAEGANASSPKYGFVLKVNSNLTNISWGYSYQSTGTSNELDSFNHILKVNHPWGGEVFLLTGTGKNNSSGIVGSMTTNDLINPQGISLWNSTKGNIDWSHILNSGRMALYNVHKNNFYILTKGMENDIQILELEGYTGNSTGSNLNLHNHNHDHYIITGMEWKDIDQTKIILTGYQIEDGTNTGAPIFVEVDLNTFPLPNSVRWIKYGTNFDGNDLLSVPFDYIVQPLIPFTFHPWYPGYHSPYYTPKSSVISVDENRLRFVTSLQNTPNTNFGLGLIDVDSNGMMERDCYEFMRNTLDVFYSTSEYNNFLKSLHRFEIIEPGAYLEQAYSKTTIICSDEAGNNSNKSINLHNESSNTLLSFYPNPTNGLVYIESTNAIDSIEVFNLAGQLINIPTMNTNILDFTNFSAGIYFVKIYIGGDTRISKIIKE